MISLLLVVCTGVTAGEYSIDDFRMGPVQPKLDLRTMVRRDIIRRSCDRLNNAAQTRQKAFDAGVWSAWRDDIRRKVLAALGEMKFGPDGPPLNIRPISRQERRGFVVENVLFESLPGWDVNASVFLPDATQFPPPWPAIIVPVGHSGKQMESYQIPAQVFARCGYVAVTFDPPGMAGEKQGGNDHFSDGVRCYLTGHSSNRYFVIDALRCIDYLATRPDVDLRNGVGMTGVSGGGATTMAATLLDDRIRASGPSCTAVPNALHPVLDVYAPCVETLPPGRFADGYDDVDVLAAAVPTPVLLMAGAKDEVFKGAWSDEIAATVRACFKQAGHEDRFAYFSDPGGHAYTVAMALEFVRWMNRWVRQIPDQPTPTFTRADFEMLPPETLQCKPRLDTSIFSVNRTLALALNGHRSGTPIRDAAMKLAHAQADIAIPKSRAGSPTLVWFHNLQELMLEPEEGIELPATFLYPARDNWRGPALLYFDDRERWTDLRGNGPLAHITHFTEEDTNGPAILAVDLRGWGDSRSSDMPYDVAGWAARSRWMAYVSAALGDPVFGMRVRDGLASLAYLRNRKEIEPNRIIVGGRGMGGVVALHVAAIDGRCAGVFSAEGLASFESLATAEEYNWSHEDFFPGVLLHYDIPELARALDCPVLLANPLTAAKTPLDEQAAEDLYQPRGSLHVRTGRTQELVQAFVSTLFAP